MTHESIAASQSEPEFTTHIHQEEVEGGGRPTTEPLIGFLDEVESVSLPELHSNDTEAVKETAWSGFFSRRREQISQITKRVNDAFQGKFSHDIDGIHFTAQEMVKARFDPDLWKSALRVSLGRSPHSRALSIDPFDEGDSYHAIIDNSVLRRAAYKQAIAGNESVADYLGENDRRFGQREMTGTDLAKETLAYFSGYAFVRKVGLTAVLGVTIAQQENSKLSEEKAQQLRKREAYLADKNSIHAGTSRITREQAAYRKLVDDRRQRSWTPPRDPFYF